MSESGVKPGVRRQRQGRFGRDERASSERAARTGLSAEIADNRATVRSSHTRVLAKVRGESVTRATEGIKGTHQAPQWGHSYAEAVSVLDVIRSRPGARVNIKVSDPDDSGDYRGTSCGSTCLRMRSWRSSLAT